MPITTNVSSVSAHLPTSPLFSLQKRSQTNPEVDSDRRTWFQVTLSLYKTLNGFSSLDRIKVALDGAT
ncbi:hypothetical protein CEP54_009043 [Fusarium duplospermum]|uniref:Uncharacterized protein n=1 Tax=Fusarium duplospermum TaxID=1325734 RepID=A0A428PST2_9HYPO|nr:hypothetical protein CEP54_009043 [Fusarium duplospermum]